MSDMCPYYEWKGGAIFGDYYCKKNNSTINSTNYEKYCKKSYERDGYGECPIYKYEESSSGCFITTIVCDIIGLEDKNIYLMLLRKFRDNYLQKNPNTIQILEEYDFIGPIISKCINTDKNKKVIAKNLFINNLVPIFDDICNDNYICAIKKYTDMVKGLIKRYNLETLSLTIPSNEYDYKKDYSSYGHGRLQHKIA